MADLTIPSGDGMLAVTHTPGQRATVVALHGASAGTRDHPLYEHLHRVLPALGVGVVTYDRRGEGASSGSSTLGRFDEQATDARALLELAGDGAVGLWGFSQGAWSATLLAASEPRVALLVGIAATGVTPTDQMLYGVAEHLRRAGFDDLVVGRALELRRAYALAMHHRLADEGELARQLREAAREPWWQLASLRTELPDDVARASWVAEMDFDPVPSMRAVRAPVLACYGEHDEWTPVEASASAWRAAQGPNVTVEVVRDVGHALLDVHGGVSHSYERALIGWLESHLPR